jgi:mevalonate kinase
MVTGEHAVIFGAPAIVAAVEQRAWVNVRFTDDKSVRIASEIAPPFRAPMTELVAQGAYRFVIACVLEYRDRLTGGLDINIRSEIDHTLGLGSSAAVTVAMLAALAGTVSENLHAQALKVTRDVQGRGSGADLSASLFGGVLSYQIEGDGPAQIRALPLPPQLSLYNVGYKTPTPKVLALVAAAREENPGKIDAIFDEMAGVSAETIQLVEEGHWSSTGPQLGSYQNLMQRLGVSDDSLDAAVERAAKCESVIGAKISGSGLGDCVLAVGGVPEGFEPIDVAQQGVFFHD